ICRPTRTGTSCVVARGDADPSGKVSVRAKRLGVGNLERKTDTADRPDPGDRRQAPASWPAGAPSAIGVPKTDALILKAPCREQPHHRPASHRGGRLPGPRNDKLGTIQKLS